MLLFGLFVLQVVLYVSILMAPFQLPYNVLENPKKSLWGGMGKKLQLRHRFLGFVFLELTVQYK